MLLLLHVQAGVAAADAGAAGLVLHARTADQQYSPPAHWEAVQQLVQAVPGLPVIGNGDVFEAADAVQLMRQTGCHGEVPLVAKQSTSKAHCHDSHTDV